MRCQTPARARLQPLPRLPQAPPRRNATFDRSFGSFFAGAEGTGSGALQIVTLSIMDQRETASLYAAVVGDRKASFYVPYFLRADERGYAPKSWNWAAFFLGVFWFLYRRQFRWAAILVMAALLASAMATQLSLAGFPTLALYAQLAFAVGLNHIYVPLHANGFYYHWIRQRVDSVKKRLPLDRSRQTAALERLQPTIHLPLFVFAVLLLLTMLILPAPSQ